MRRRAAQRGAGVATASTDPAPENASDRVHVPGGHEADPISAAAVAGPARAATRPRARAATSPTRSRPAASSAAAAAAKVKTATPTQKAADPATALRRRQASLQRGLDAVVDFVDGPPRRGTATACADALLLAVPKKDRGPHVDAYLHAAGAKEAPTRLQELAEDAGMELATAIKALGRTRAASTK